MEEEEEPGDSNRAVGTVGSSWSSRKEHRLMDMEFGRSQGAFLCSMLLDPVLGRQQLESAFQAFQRLWPWSSLEDEFRYL